MIVNENKNFKTSLVLFELGNKFDFLIKLYKSNKFPAITMFTGIKGIGKFTLINHLLTYIFDSKNYDIKERTINSQTQFYTQYSNNIFPNIIYLSGNEFKNVKVDDIRNLKSTILKSTMTSQDRFIVLDDIELFNLNSLNALLKILEDPILNNYFILINNKTKPLIETIYSRSLEFKIILNDHTRINIIESLIKKNDLKVLINYNFSSLSPGNFLLFNKICAENNIEFNADFLSNLETLLNLYKKNKSLDLINFILFLSEYYFYHLKENKINDIEQIIDKKFFVTNNINKFFNFNLNPKSLINIINSKLSNG